MGQCGCGDFHPQFKLPGPEGSFYALQLYTGCLDCRTPAGIIVAKLKGDEVDEWDVKHIPDLTWTGSKQEPEPDYQERALALVDIEKLAKYLGLEDDDIEVYRGIQAALPDNP